MNITWGKVGLESIQIVNRLEKKQDFNIIIEEIIVIVLTMKSEGNQ